MTFGEFFDTLVSQNPEHAHALNALAANAVEDFWQQARAAAVTADRIAWLIPTVAMVVCDLAPVAESRLKHIQSGRDLVERIANLAAQQGIPVDTTTVSQLFRSTDEGLGLTVPGTVRLTPAGASAANALLQEVRRHRQV